MKSLGLSQKDVQFKNKWRTRIKGQLANPDLPRQMAIKTVCAHACTARVCDRYMQHNNF